MCLFAFSSTAKNVPLTHSHNHIKTASWDENVSLPALYYSCRLLGMLKDLAARNSELRKTAKSRIDKSLELVRDLFVKRPASGDSRNTPRLVVLEIMADLVVALPDKLLTMGPSFDQVYLFPTR